MRMSIFGEIHGLTWTKYLGICTSLVTSRAPWMGQTESTEFMTSQSPGTKRYVPIQMPACRTSVNQSQANHTLVIVHRDHPPSAYPMPRLPAVNSIIG